jgi:hypothetical protein
MQENPQASELHALATRTRAPHNAPATADLLRTIFRQPKIEFFPNVHLFAFDFMAEASDVTPAIVSGTVRGSRATDRAISCCFRPVAGRVNSLFVALGEDAPILSAPPGRRFPWDDRGDLRTSFDLRATPPYQILDGAQRHFYKQHPTTTRTSDPRVNRHIHRETQKVMSSRVTA